jgi:hypothetical protein
MEFSEVKTLLECVDCSDGSPGAVAVNIQHAYATDLMSEVLASPKPGAILLTGLANTQTIRTCKIARISAVVFVRDKKPNRETSRLAYEYQIPTASTRLSMFDACGILFSKGIKGIPSGD